MNPLIIGLPRIIQKRIRKIGGVDKDILLASNGLIPKSEESKLFFEEVTEDSRELLVGEESLDACVIAAKAASSGP